mgnify:CR=1 FL=1
MEVTIISIHALREEGDPSWQMSEMTGMNFYPRPPRGGRHHLSYDLNDCILFLSTPSARRATAYDLTMTYPIVDFYPRPPRGGRRAAVRQQPRGDAISIHALREEGDLELDPWCEALETFLSTPSARRATCRPLGLSVRQEFLSTPSARRATARIRAAKRRRMISIHALREEGDAKTKHSSERWRNFYPRPPRGGRRPCGCSISTTTDFYPRPPRGGRLYPHGRCHPDDDISIHALREEGDGRCTGYCLRQQHFYPRPPRGGRHCMA